MHSIKVDRVLWLVLCRILLASMNLRSNRFAADANGHSATQDVLG